MYIIRTESSIITKRVAQEHQIHTLLYCFMVIFPEDIAQLKHVGICVYIYNMYKLIHVF
jgi:hypothetical protein